MNIAFVGKFLLAIIACLFSILSYVIFTTLGALPEKPDREDVSWSYVGKALAGVTAFMSVGIWYLVFAV